MNIYLTAIITSKPEFLQEVKAVLENMVVHTRKESACLQYDLHQSIENENIFVFYEIWENQFGLDNHNTQSYIEEFRQLVTEKLAELPEIYLTQKVS